MSYVKSLIRLPNWLLAALSFFALAGFLDSLYLTVKHYVGGPVPCSILNGCEKVLQSSYANVFGLPVSLFGAVYYFLVIIAILIYLDSKRAWPLHIAAGLIGLGFIASLWFVYLQVFVIRSLCLYCLGSAVSTTALLVLTVFVLKLAHHVPPDG